MYMHLCNSLPYGIRLSLGKQWNAVEGTYYFRIKTKKHLQTVPCFQQACSQNTAYQNGETDQEILRHSEKCHLQALNFSKAPTQQPAPTTCSVVELSRVSSLVRAFTLLQCLVPLICNHLRHFKQPRSSSKFLAPGYKNFCTLFQAISFCVVSHAAINN